MYVCMYHHGENQFNALMLACLSAMPTRFYRQSRRQIKVTDVNFDAIVQRNAIDNPALVARMKQSVYIVQVRFSPDRPSSICLIFGFIVGWQIDNMLVFYHPHSGKRTFKILSDGENDQLLTASSSDTDTTCMNVSESSRSYLFDMLHDSAGNEGGTRHNTRIAEANKCRVVLQAAGDFLLQAMTSNASHGSGLVGDNSEVDDSGGSASCVDGVWPCTAICSHGPHILPWELLSFVDSGLFIVRRLNLCSMLLQYADTKGIRPQARTTGPVSILPSYLTFRSPSRKKISHTCQKTNYALRTIFGLNLGVSHIISSDKRAGIGPDIIPLDVLFNPPVSKMNPLFRVLKTSQSESDLTWPPSTSSRDYKAYVNLCAHVINSL
jgi:hypothetical protein